MTKEDFLRNELPKPGWHPCVIKEAKLVKTKGGINEKTGKEKDIVDMITARFEITEGDDKGKAIFQNYPENFPLLMVMLMNQGFGVPLNKDGGIDVDVEPENLVNKTVDVHIVRGSYNNKPKNEIDGYKKYTGRS